MPGGDLGGRAHETALLRQRIVELRDEGRSFRQICTEVDRSLHVVWDHYQAAMRQVPAAAVEEHQKKVASRLDEQLRRIDMEREVLMEILAKRHVTISNGHVVSEIVGEDEETGKPIYGEPFEDDAPTMAAVDRLGKLDDQEAKLLGMYPKQQVSISRETSELDAAVITLIGKAKERADAKRAEIEQRAAGQ
jgi:hypothetical protein